MLARRIQRMSHNDIVAVIGSLAEKWPCCFSIPESRRRPLKLGIREDVLASLDGAIPAGKVSAALRWYVSSPEYQRRLVHGACLGKYARGAHRDATFSTHHSRVWRVGTL